MTYAGERVIHDADSHLMESPNWLIDHADPGVRERLRPLWMQGLAEVATATLEEMQARKHAEADFWEQAEAKLMVRKNWKALGAAEPGDRSRALDLLGFRSQLVFSTYGSGVLLNHPHHPRGADFDPEVLYGAVDAHNRGVTEFCAHDPRLLPVGWVSLDDPERAVAAARRALAWGVAALEVPSYPAGPLSLTHPAFHPIYRMLEEAGRPLIFHVGGGGRLASAVFLENGLPHPTDFHGGEENLRAMDFMGIPAPVELALAALVFDGVLELYPRLKVGVIEQGATWVPGFVRRLDQALRAFGKSEERLAVLPMAPSDYVRRQVRVTPFPFEPVGWLIDQAGADLFLFSSDYPHVEGGRHPLRNFADSLEGHPEDHLDRFYRANFEDLMGPTLPV